MKSKIEQLALLISATKMSKEQVSAELNNLIYSRFQNAEDALGYINRTSFRYQKGDSFVNQLNEEQLIRFATILSELP